MTTQAQTTEVSKHKLSIDTCVKVMADSLLFGRKSLHTELSVCLSIFAGAGNTSAETKTTVMGIYQQAGYKWDKATDAHYKTVNRRMNASASLYEKIGAETIQKWIGDAEEAKLLEAVSQGLETHQFESMDDVLEFVGKDNNRKRNTGAAKPAGRGKKEKAQKPEVPMYKIHVGRVRLEIPQETSAADLVKIASKILDLGRKKEQEELKGAVAHPSSAAKVAPAVVH